MGRKDARREVGLMYLHGYGTEVDLLTAQKWLELAVTSGDIEAKYELSSLYMILKDEGKAVRLIREAAEGGVTKAQIDLASRYVAGRGVEQSKTQAYAWCIIAKDCNQRVSYECKRYGDMLDEDELSVANSKIKKLREVNQCTTR